MKKETKKLTLEGVHTKAELLIIEESDRFQIKKLYKYWKILNKGMKFFMSRGINLPEGISESALCLCFGKNYARAVKIHNGSGSFDVINLKNKKRIQIKASSVDNDLTSFGPKSVWDEIYFLDFYREGKFDGSFNVYKIPNNLIYNHKMNTNQTFKDQQSQGRRPRLSLKEIILKHKLKILKKCKL